MKVELHTLEIMMMLLRQGHHHKSTTAVEGNDTKVGQKLCKISVSSRRALRDLKLVLRCIECREGDRQTNRGEDDSTQSLNVTERARERERSERARE